MVTITLNEYRELLISNVEKDHKIGQLETRNLMLASENNMLRNRAIKACKKEKK
jgi:hypothetical protein